MGNHGPVEVARIEKLNRTGTSEHFYERPVLPHSSATSPKCGRIWRTHGGNHGKFGRNWPKLVDLGPTLAAGRVRSKLVGFGRIRPIGPNSGKTAQFWSNLTHK